MEEKVRAMTDCGAGTLFEENRDLTQPIYDKIRDAYKRPFLSWCLIARNCAKTLEATLKSLRERTPEAEIVVVDTMSGDGGATRGGGADYGQVVSAYDRPHPHS